jgi:hypothetical protein
MEPKYTITRVSISIRLDQTEGPPKWRILSLHTMQEKLSVQEYAEFGYHLKNVVEACLK